jgi:DNA-binding XRE family transcriptional regulator
MVHRIRELLETRQLSPTQFADLIGVGRPVISHILSERNKPSLEVVQKVLDAFPDVSLTWLLKGIGPMLTDTSTAPVVPAATPVPPAAVTEAIAAVPPVAPAPVGTTGPLVSLHPQAFAPYTASATNTVRPAAAPAPPSRPLPPRFRPGSAKAPATSPQPAAATLLSTEPAGTIPVAEVSATTAMATPPPLASNAAIAAAVGSPSAVPAGSEDNELTEQVVPQPPVAFALPTASLAGMQAPESATVAMGAPTTAEPTVTNPAAALSFLGEPGKAIRRIVIFYRDGSFSDYVPEGQ